MFFVDAAHFVTGSFLGWLWCRADVCAGRLWASALQRLGSPSCCDARVDSGEQRWLHHPTTVCELLRKIASRNLPTPVTLVMDNARYQRCRLVQDLAAELGIELLFLPSYSPNLNLIERLWKFVKKTALNSRRHPSFAEFQGAINDCLDPMSYQTFHPFTTRTVPPPSRVLFLLILCMRGSL